MSIFETSIFDNGSNNNLSIPNKHIFNSTDERDTYFETNPTELIKNIYVIVDGTLQKYNGEDWTDITPVIQGPKGDTGLRGPQGIQGETGAQGPAGKDSDVTYDDIYNSIGKFIQYDLNGTFENNQLIFEAPADETITLENNKYYEFDLHAGIIPIRPDVQPIPDDTPMFVKVGEDLYTLQSILGNATFGNLKQIVEYNTESGFRWIFDGTVGIVDSLKVITLPSAIINPANLDLTCLTKISNDDMLNATIDGLLNGTEITNDNLFIASDDNGYSIGHIYKFVNNDGTYDWVDINNNKPIIATDDDSTAVTIDDSMLPNHVYKFNSPITSLNIDSFAYSDIDEITVIFNTSDTEINITVNDDLKNDIIGDYDIPVNSYVEINILHGKAVFGIIEG